MCSRDVFHFSPADLNELRFGSDSSSVASGDAAFDLEKWKGKFKGLHAGMASSMYFL